MQSAGCANHAEDAERYGLAGLLLDLWRRRKAARSRGARQMQLIETLPLGGKRQLMLVQCGSERFLVGGGFDGIETIVKVGWQWSAVEGHMKDEICQ